MSRLDDHILSVRNRLTLGVFLQAWAWAGFLLGIVVLLAIVGQRLLDRNLPHAGILFWLAVGATGAGALVYSLIFRPSGERAAMKIDEVLGLKEKFSTALYMRSSQDPFAQAAVKDAERAAEGISLDRRFPVKFPRWAIATAAVFLAVFLLAQFMPTLHLLLAKPAPAQAKLAAAGPSPHRDEFMKQALPTIMAPAALPNSSEALRKAADELNKAAHTDEGDALRNHRSVLSALQNYKDAMAQELAKNEKYQTVLSENDQMSAIASAKDDSTPIGNAQNALKAGDLGAAMKDIAAGVRDFDKSKPEDQQKMIDQAANLAAELSKAANDPRVGQRIAQQLMQMGATQTQAQQMSAAMQQAAQGNKQAQQQLQQMARQVAQQMNNGQGPTQQQQQQIQSMMTKAQSLANSQMQAQALSSAAQRLAMVMVQGKGSAQSASSGLQSKSGQGNARQGNSSQSMAGAQQGMQQQLQQMQAQAKDAQAMQAGANAAAQAAADAAAGLNTPGEGDGSDADAGNQGQGQGQNPQAQGGHGQGAGGLGPGGAKMPIAMAPYTFKQELDPSKDIQGGKVLASRYVKAGIDPGKSTAGLKDVAAAAEKDAPDEIDQDRIPREAQQAEKDYFTAIQQQDGQ